MSSDVLVLSLGIGSFLYNCVWSPRAVAARLALSLVDDHRDKSRGHEFLILDQQAPLFDGILFARKRAHFRPVRGPGRNRILRSSARVRGGQDGRVRGWQELGIAGLAEVSGGKQRRPHGYLDTLVLSRHRASLRPG